jgi:4a-hydroxytetrahydrobiopterin dehydratase
MWQYENNTLKRTFEFSDFTEAFAFMTQVAFAAERMGHHPNWSNVWNRVEISLSTHDAGNQITDKDFVLARIIDSIADKFLKN